MDNNNENQIIITVTGADKIGIVAAVSNKLAQYCVNIEDIKQTIMQNSFCMIMLCDIKNMNVSFKEFKDSILELSQALSMEIWIQKKDLFDRMHNI
ncbi:MAG: ACT domain-containing protein [Candidatus Gastranaerophilales bacterium]|nr:ACT domain-containing protein [Candidatus Gastranaerophilales bacterium]